ncbi:MAG: hypothetical protein HOV67_27510 [Kribbellaceae bacterium]|nr:hypothetical protein [Kribbellaceae bacterium]
MQFVDEPLGGQASNNKPGARSRLREARALLARIEDLVVRGRHRPDLTDLGAASRTEATVLAHESGLL